MPTNSATVAAIAAGDLTFGIEIECVVPVGLTIARGGYHSGTQIRQFPAGWNGQSDASIRYPEGFKPIEIVSPVLKGADGLRQVAFVLGWLQQNGARVNSSCGFHVHVGLPEGRTRDLSKVVALVARHEAGLFAITGTRSRENGSYAKPIRDAYQYAKFKNGDADAHETYNLPDDRFCSLNLTNLRYGRKPTMEFRVFAGTLNPVKMFGYIRVCLGIVERALNSRRAITWDMARTERQRERHAVRGAGKHATMELIYGLNWKGGGREYGDVPGVSGMPSTPAIVAELYRLAEKYDARNETEE